MNRIDVLKSVVSAISDMLQSQEFLDAHHFPNRFVRNRMLSMYQVVLFLLYFTKQALHQNISRIIDLGVLNFNDVSKQAVSRARQGIMPSLFKDLFDVSVEIFSKSQCPRRLWLGRETVYAIDGSRIQLPNSSSNYEKYGKMSGRKNPGRHWSLALASVIYDVTNDYFCHSLIRPILSSECMAATSFVRSFFL